jgi:hypothetical protein
MNKQIIQHPQWSTNPQYQTLRIGKRKKVQRTQKHDYKNDQHNKKDMYQKMNEFKEDTINS